MGWRCVMVERPARLSVRQGQLLIRQEEEHSIPIEDLNALLLESRQVQVTAAALGALAEGGVALWVCDEKHLPCGVLLPYAQHSRHLAVARLQMDAGQARKKRLWQQIVNAKITNQAKCLRLMRREQAAQALDVLAAGVTSGDGGRAEAAAAALYFPALFGTGFTRLHENGINAALNYGYALIRGLMARTLTVYGFQCYLGLCHHNQLNAFNLADDMMEPFRPLVDLYAAQYASADMLLTSQEKRHLFSLLTMRMRSGGQKHSVGFAMERAVQSLARALERGGQPRLMLPELLPLVQHEYE